MNKEKMNEQQKSNIVYRIICAWCGKDLGPSYGTRENSHGICPDCAEKLIGRGDK